MNTVRWLPVLFLAAAAPGCGGGGGGPDAAPVDAEPVDASPPDAAPVDAAPVDAEPVDASPPDAASPLHRQYVIDRLTLPRDGRDALRLDIDGDGTRENRLATVLNALLQQSGGDEERTLVFLRQHDVDRAVDRGDLISLVDLASPSFREGEIVDVVLVDGADPVPAPCDGSADVTCRRHLDGTGRFRSASDAVPGTASGAVIAGDIVAGPGRVTLRLPFASGQVVELPLAHARIELHDVTTGVAGLLGGGVSRADIDAVLVPAIAADYVATVDATCGGGPGADACGCPPGSGGRALLGIFDVDNDCTLTIVEVGQSPFIRTLFSPDLDLEAPVMHNDALSVVVGVGAVPATWTAAP